MSNVLDAAPARPALSANFGSWDEIRPTTDGMQWLCRACAWSYISKDSRRRSYRITPRGYTPALWSTIAAELSAGPLPQSVAWSIPLAFNRIVLPRAHWGMVATDNAVTPWEPPHVDALQAVLNLRAAGASEAELKAGKPLLGIGDTPHDQARTAHLWDSLRPWRKSPLWPLLIKLSRPSRIETMA